VELPRACSGVVQPDRAFEQPVWMLLLTQVQTTPRATRHAQGRRRRRRRCSPLLLCRHRMIPLVCHSWLELLHSPHLLRSLNISLDCSRPGVLSAFCAWLATRGEEQLCVLLRCALTRCLLNSCFATDWPAARMPPASYIRPDPVSLLVPCTPQPRARCSGSSWSCGPKALPQRSRGMPRCTRCLPCFRCGLLGLMSCCD